MTVIIALPTGRMFSLFQQKTPRSFANELEKAVLSCLTAVSWHTSQTHTYVRALANIPLDDRLEAPKHKMILIVLAAMPSK